MTRSGNEKDCLLACSALSAAAARLAATLQDAGAPWRERARRLVEAAATLGGDVDALRVVRSRVLRRQQVARIGTGADDAAALAMRLHNLMPRSAASAAAFDVAACAASLAVAVRALPNLD